MQANTNINVTLLQSHLLMVAKATTSPMSGNAGCSSRIASGIQSGSCFSQVPKNDVNWNCTALTSVRSEFHDNELNIY